MSARLEILLARLYTDDRALQAYLADPHTAAMTAGLDASEREALRQVRFADLAAAARAFGRKRAHRSEVRIPVRAWRRDWR